MKRLLLIVCIVALTGCGIKRIGSRIAKAAIAQVSTEQQVSFTPTAKQVVVMKTTEFLEPRAGELQDKPELESEFLSQTKAALTQQVELLTSLRSDDRTINAQDLRWLDIAVHDYGSLTLTSEPAGAGVYLTSHGNSFEGTTRIDRSYPVATYTFDLKRERCRDARLTVTIKKNLHLKHNIKLHCE